MNTFPAYAVIAKPSLVSVPTYADAALDESYRQACFAVLYCCVNNGSPAQIRIAAERMIAARVPPVSRVA